MRPVATVCHDAVPEPSVCKYWPELPALVGSVSVHAAVELLDDLTVVENVLLVLVRTSEPCVVPCVPVVSAPAVVVNAPVTVKLVPVAAPMTGVVKVGDVASTILPEPVVLFPRAVTVPEVGRVRVVVPVVVNVVLNAPEVASVEPSANVRVAPVAGAVTVTLLMVVADATPKVGVVSVGLVANTTLPEPVVANSPRTPALSYNRRPEVPPAMAVVPRIKPELAEAGCQDVMPVPSVVRTKLLVPAVVGRVNDHVPAVALG